ncbi:hypothetical protein GWI33_011133 [Rhynchophorus ferrugineus]|uniref:Uncharacterized protein n=1 Tax=Rhynchophorus ferrugineus TaxID=354439 RepID=A0A834MIT1_RHYFE|nr:hypothetical protein GWI33_011133 [Rhynchophorus ferrugineus]
MIQQKRGLDGWGDINSDDISQKDNLDCLGCGRMDAVDGTYDLRKLLAVEKMADAAGGEGSGDSHRTSDDFSYYL